MNMKQREHLAYRLRNIAYQASNEIESRYENLRRNIREKEYPNVCDLSVKAKIEQIKKGIAKMRKKSDIVYNPNSDALSMIFTFTELTKTEREKLQTEMDAKLQQLRDAEKQAKEKLEKERIHLMDAAILGDDAAALKSIEDFQNFCKQL